MAHEPARAPGRIATALALMLLLAAAPAHALKVATWNLLAYPEDSLSFRQPKLRTILAALDPDVLVTEETDFSVGKDSLLVNVLNVIEPGQWTGAWVRVGQGTGSSADQGAAIFWKPALVSVSNITSTNTPTGGAWPRSELLALVKPVGYVKNGAWFRVYGIHLKAGAASPSTTDSTQRRAECTSLRTILNNQNITTVGPNFLILGDTNFYSGLEGGYIRLTESQSNNNGRAFDPISMPGDWHTIYQYRANFSQCPCNTGCWSAQSGGGLDDRFDLILTSASMQDGAGLDVIPNSYLAFGNDGNHYNSDINSPANGIVSAAVANALHDASDHIPVMFTLQLPARYAAPSQLSFGDVIVGGSPAANLSVANAGPVPSATLAYTLSASAGFTAPAGPFNAAAGAAANLHALGMDASTVGAMSGTVTLASNDNDTTSKAILLDGRVLAHAVPSLDSTTVVTAGAVDFGDLPPGAFTDQPVRVFDQGWNTLQARLALTGASITGDSRFSLAGGFSPATFGSPGSTLAVHFDDSSAPLDSVYTATLTLDTADDALPGATALSPLTVTLRAHVVSGGTGVGEHALRLRFDPPSPNPARSGALMAFDLPHAAPVSLGVYDLSGRRIARLADGEVGQGHHALRWNAQNDAGQSVPAGLYFVRFATPGLTRVSRLVLLP